MYLPLLAFFAGYRVVFEERARAYDFSTSAHVEFQRKVRTLAGVFQIIRFFPALLGRGNRMWFHFLSHKVARLLLPYALVVLGVTSYFLPQPIRIPALGVQAVFYLIGSMNCWVPQRNPLKRLSSPANAFLLLMLAALSAVKILFVPARGLWKETHVHP